MSFVSPPFYDVFFSHSHYEYGSYLYPLYSAVQVGRANNESLLSDCIILSTYQLDSLVREGNRKIEMRPMRERLSIATKRTEN